MPLLFNINNDHLKRAIRTIRELAFTNTVIRYYDALLSIREIVHRNLLQIAATIMQHHRTIVLSNSLLNKVTASLSYMDPTFFTQSIEQLGVHNDKHFFVLQDELVLLLTRYDRNVNCKMQELPLVYRVKHLSTSVIEILYDLISLSKTLLQ